MRSLLIEHRVILHRFHKFVVAGNRCVVFQHIKNKAFLNSLLHCIYVEWAMFHIVAILIRNTKCLQRFIFRSSRESKIAGICQQLMKPAPKICMQPISGGVRTTPKTHCHQRASQTSSARMLNATIWSRSTIYTSAVENGAGDINYIQND